MDKIAISLGFIQIRWYSLFIFIAMLVAIVLIVIEAKKKKIPEDYLSNLLFYGILIGILGARMYYVIFNINYYIQQPLEIIQIWHGGLAIHGGIIAALIFLIIYSNKKRIKTLLMTDIIVVGLIIAQAIGRWGNFFNGEAFGRIVDLQFLENLHLPEFIINGMYIDGLYREPTFLYESVLSLIGFIILIIIRKKTNIKTGQLTGIYLIWYGAARLLVESFRSDSLMLSIVKVAQLVSVIAIIIGIYLIIKTRNNKLYKEDKITQSRRKYV